MKDILRTIITVLVMLGLIWILTGCGGSGGEKAGLSEDYIKGHTDGWEGGKQYTIKNYERVIEQAIVYNDAFWADVLREFVDFYAEHNCPEHWEVVEPQSGLPIVSIAGESICSPCDSGSYSKGVTP